MVGKMLRKLWDLNKKLLKQEEIKNPRVQSNSAKGNEDSLSTKNVPDTV